VGQGYQVRRYQGGVILRQADRSTETKVDGREPLWVDAVEKGFLALERGKVFQKQANIENID
jgi:hypothetical protein